LVEISLFYRTIELSVDVGRTAKELLSLLEKASNFQAKWREPVVIEQMITRYYRFMQLKAYLPEDLFLVPTIDIEIVWQTHLLRPEMYRNDCLRLFRRVIDHSLLISDIQQVLQEQAFVTTCQLYEQRFGEQYCPLPSTKKKKITTPEYTIYGRDTTSERVCLIPVTSYWDQTHFEFSSITHADYENVFSFAEADIILDGNWLDLCKRFMREMLSKVPSLNYGPIISIGKKIRLSAPEINRLKKSYERFLYMAAKYPAANGHVYVPPTCAVGIFYYRKEKHV
jgi:hypothetical protein